MKVMITKCSSNIYWYCGKIGNVYEVRKHDDKWYVCESDNISLIRIEDVLPVCSSSAVSDFEQETPKHVEQAKPIDSHYTGFTYSLTEADKQSGVLKVDPYFVSKQWNLGAKDSTGVLFHCLKNISRYSDKNTKEREIRALHLQVKRLAELEGVTL